jgi:hypothetical protein
MFAVAASLWAAGLFPLSASPASAPQAARNSNAADPFWGTWKLNLAKSRYNPGPPPRNQTYTFEPSGANGVKFTAKGVDARGNPILIEYLGTFDGQEFPVRGNRNSNRVVLNRIDRYTVEGENRQGGRVIRRFRRVVSEDGKTMTVTETGTDVNGVVSENVAVYDRQ